MTLKSRLGVTYPVKLCTIGTSLQSTDPGLSFVAADSMRLSSFASIHSELREKLCSVRYYVTIVQGQSRLIEIESGTNLKQICDFLLVFCCNYMPVFCRFRDITIY